MQYKNTKTGVIIDTPSVVNGGDWVPYDERFAKKLEIEEAKESNQDEDVPPNTADSETVENAAPGDITKADIMQELDAFGIQYDKHANKQVLYDLMMEQGKE